MNRYLTQMNDELRPFNKIVVNYDGVHEENRHKCASEMGVLVNRMTVYGQCENEQSEIELTVSELPSTQSEKPSFKVLPKSPLSGIEFRAFGSSTGDYRVLPFGIYVGANNDKCVRVKTPIYVFVFELAPESKI